MIWKTRPTVADLRALSADTAPTHLGVEFLEVGDDFLSARMPVDARTRQPMGILHGGASVLLAETLGSLGAHYALDSRTHYCVGLDINANHLRAVRGGWVTGVARPIHIGSSTQVWEIRLTDEAGKLTCIARLTLAVLSHARP